MAKEKLSEKDIVPEKDIVLEAITKINTEISKEIEDFLLRKGMTKSLAKEIGKGTTELSMAPGFAISEADQARFNVLSNLKKDINAVKINLEQDESTTGLAEKYQLQLKQAIEPAVSNPALTKQYSGLKKLGITLLNIVTSITVIPALIKKAGTGSLLYSTQGKSKEAVNKANKIIDTVAPKKKKPK